MDPEEEARREARERYRALLAVEEPDLDRAAATLSLLGHPGLQVDAVLAGYDGIADQVRASVVGGARPTTDDLNRVLFETLGYRGNSTHYYDPRNSYMSDVLERRTGIPISLSMLYIAVARRVGIDATGVGFPGHFLVRIDAPTGPHYIDAFDKGVQMDRASLARRLSDMSGGSIELAPHHLEASEARPILQRMLANLRAIHAHGRRATELLEVIEWSLITDPASIDLRRERGLVYFALGHLPAARRDLEHYLERGPRGAPEREAAEALLERLDGSNDNLSVH